MSRKKIKIRVDGGESIGHGHLIRCFSLAKMLSITYEISFYCLEAADEIIKDFKRNAFKFYYLENENQFLEGLLENDIVVLDHYGLGSEYQKKIKGKGCKLVCIDDLKDKFYYADLIINHAPGVKELDYSTLTNSNTRFALGLEYALLRPSFIKASKEKIEIDKRPLVLNSVLICFGGSDINNLTYKLADMLIKIGNYQKISIIVGASYMHYNSLKDLDNKSNKLNILTSLSEEEMLNEMKSCDFAILPSSSVLFELCSVCKPVISGFYVNNQEEAYHAFLDKNMILGIGNFNELTLKKLSSQLLALTLADKVEELKKRQKQFFNGKVEENLRRKFKEIEV